MKIILYICLLLSFPSLIFSQSLQRELVLSTIQDNDYSLFINYVDEYALMFQMPIDSIIVATEKEMIACEKILYLEFISKNDFPINMYWDSKYTFSESCKCASEYFIKLLSEKINLKYTIGLLKDSPIAIAATTGNIDIVKYLISVGFDPNVKNFANQSALYGAAESGSLELVKFLVEEIGLKIDDKDTMGRSPLYSAVFSNKFDVFEYLLKKGNLKIDPTKDIQLYSFAASFEERLNILSYLVTNFGVDNKTKDYVGNTLLLNSIDPVSSPKSVKFLIEHGANPNDINFEGKNALFYCTYGDEELFNIFLKAGIDINQLDTTGRTSFEYMVNELLFILVFKAPVEEYGQIGVLPQEISLINMLLKLNNEGVRIKEKSGIIYLAEQLVENDAIALVDYLIDEHKIDDKSKDEFKKAIKKFAIKKGKVKFLKI